MRQRSVALLAIATLLLFLVPVAYGIGSGNSIVPRGETVGTLPSSPSYSESLSLYLTAAETFWQMGFSGGNISLSSLNIPSSVTSFSITLTHYQKWNSKFEIFGKNGFGLLGPFQPLPDGAILSVSTTSSSDAANLANSLSQMFALAFTPYISSASSFTFISPMNFQTEVHTSFWKLVPSSYRGFATQLTEAKLESGDLSLYRLSYSLGAYSISIGGLTPLVSSSFSLYTQLGVSQNFNYSGLASGSSVAVHVLGGLISNSSYTFTNYYNNFSATMYESSSGVNKVVPNLNATLDFSFPTIVASRQIATLNPATNTNVTVTISVKNVSPSGTSEANKVSVNDTWVLNSTAFKITQGQASGNQNLSAGQSMTVAYAFRVLPAAKSITIPPIPVTYSFKVGNKSITNQVLLNTEILTINGTGPALEAIESVNSGSIQTGQPILANISVTNKGSDTAFSLTAAGQKRANLLQGQTWSFIATSQSSPFTLANATLSYAVSWNESGIIKTIETNSFSAIYNLAAPSSPASSISKSVTFFHNSNSANVTLNVLDNSAVAISNLTVSDSLPSGLEFAKSYEPNSLKFSNGLVSANVSSLAPGDNINFTYALNVTNINENYVFMPANVSSIWGNLTIVHFSQGEGLPLGVKATKEISPSGGFQGSAISVKIGVTNQGTLPVYYVSLNTTGDSFLAISGKNSTFKSVLASGASISSTLDANLTGTPGVYNTSSSAASFVFAGSNKTATSNVFSITIFKSLQGQISVVSSKIEEAHNIVIMYEVTNPSNVTVSNVSFNTSLPTNLKLISGAEIFQVSSLAPGASYKNNITIYTNLPETYNLNGGTLKFQYNGQTLQGQTSGFSLNVSDDLTLRYGIPVLIGLVIVILTLLYVRRLTQQKK